MTSFVLLPGDHCRLQGHLLLEHRLPVDRRQRDAPRRVRLQDVHQPAVQGSRPPKALIIIHCTAGNVLSLLSTK